MKSVEKLVVGLPVHEDGNFTGLKTNIDDFVQKFKTKFAHIPVDFADEQFSSVHAKKSYWILASKKEKKR
ncbi:MAG: Holliday junction resolvase RuvX [Saprospiraceae bacterium]|nr:Holliday junction resolvase RuvX [Saprospiraceae bacterium]